MPQPINPWAAMPPPQYGVMPSPEQMLFAQNSLPPEVVPEAQPAFAPIPQMARNGLPPEAYSAVPSLMPKLDYDESARRLNEKGIDSLRLQGLGIKNQEAQRGFIEAMPYQTDLTPLTNLLDQWTGQNTTKGYKRPTTPEERNAMLMNLEAGIQKSREGLSENEMTLLSSQLGLAQAKEAREERAQARKDDRNLRRELAQAKDSKPTDAKILPQAVVDKYNDAQGAVGMATNLKADIESNHELMGPVKGKAGMFNPYSVDQKKLIAKFDGVRQQIGHMIEGGVLRKEDEEKYARILPTITDLPEVALDKAKNVEIMLKDDISRYMENYGKAGYRVIGFADETAGYKKDAATLKNKGNKTAKTTSTEEDEVALTWAKNNPNDPYAQEILKVHGVK